VKSSVFVTMATCFGADYDSDARQVIFLPL
jgi:hypothetical protein